MATLTELRERVAKVTGPDPELDYALTEWADPGAIRYSSAHLHYTASIDAALFLAERMLPGWSYIIDSRPNRTNVLVRLYAPGLISADFSIPGPDHAQGEGHSVPTAILLALLNAIGTEAGIMQGEATRTDVGGNQNG